MSKLIIFDFDGVLNDSLEALYELNFLAGKHLDKRISKSDYLNFFSSGGFHNNLEKFLNLGQEELMEFKNFKSSIYDSFYSKTRLYDFTVELINTLQAKGYLLVIISSAPPFHIDKTLTNAGIRQAFLKISGINKQGKANAITSIAKQLDVDKTNCVFITDTVGDIVDGRLAGIRTIAVTWGFHNKEELLASHPDCLITTSKELFNLF